MIGASSSFLRIAVVQFAPKLGEVHANIAKARELCRGLTPRSVDLVCFPEMIFSGYMFPDAPSIAPYLEHPETGLTSTFCAELARHLQCYVAAGFPERLEPSAMESPAPSDPSLLSSTSTPTPTSTSTTTTSVSSSSPSSPLLSSIGANSALVYDATGHLLHTYHKSNLFPTDITWARPGSGFTTLDLPMPFGRTAVAICNDLNVNVSGPDGGVWRSIEMGPYELAGYCRREGVRMLVLLNAWLRSEEEEEKERKEVKVRGRSGVDAGRGGDDRDRIAGTGTDGNGRLEDDKDTDSEEDDRDGDDNDGLEPDWRVLNYWAMRLRPLWAKDVDASMDTNADAEESARRSKTSAEMARTDDEREFLVVICNRFGHERGKTFAGSSAMFSMRPGSGRPRLLHVMGEREEGVSVWTVRIGSHTLA